MAEEKVSLLPPRGNRENALARVGNFVQDLESRLNGYHVEAIRFIRAREFMAEFLATFMLVTIGNGAVAQFKLSAGAFGTFLTVNIGYAIGVMVGAYVAGGVTGAHMNPAVTLAMAMRGKTPWIMVIPYWIAQFLGAFFSSAVVYGVYVDAIDKFNSSDPNCIEDGVMTSKLPLCTGGIFATYPAPHLSLANGILDQVLGTFLLVLGIFAICDANNNEVKSGLKPLMIGFLLWGIGGSFGFNCGYAVNPARDFSPRLFTAMAGWGADVFTCSQCPFHHWWWVPLVAPMIGAAIATLVYWLMIESHHPCPEENPGTIQEPLSRKYT